jgi:hypothetical protein
MRLLVDIHLPARIEGATEHGFPGGKPVYELVARDGRTFAMQSYSRIVDDTLTQEGLASLADRLGLATDRRYPACTLEQVMTSYRSDRRWSAGERVGSQGTESTVALSVCLPASAAACVSRRF